jgi:hypothetical protein
MKPISRAATGLSVASLLGAAVASVTTLAWRGAFPDPPPPSALNGALAEARGWSLVTLAVALPLLAVSLVLARRGSLRGRLVWLGTLAYLIYTYLELAVSPPFTPLYLVYVATFACAIPALLIGIASIDLDALPAAFGERTPRRLVAAFATATAVLLTLAWLKGIVARIAARDFGWPNGEAAIGHVVHALDLGLQVPLAVATALLLLRRRPAGHLAAAVMVVNAVCMGAALFAMVAASALTSGQSPWRALPFAVVPAIALALAIAFFRAAPRARPGVT